MKDQTSLIQKIENYVLIASAVLASVLLGERMYTEYITKKAPTAIEQKVIEEKPKIQLEKKTLENKVDQSQYSIPNTDGNFLNDSEEILLARLIYGEARGEPYDTKVAIAQTVLNRVKEKKWYGKNLQEVILKPKQFSCFNPNDPNFEKLKNPLKYEKLEVWQECYAVAKKVLNREVKDVSQGANHYCTNNPSWAKNKQPLSRKGNIKFYKLE